MAAHHRLDVDAGLQTLGVMRNVGSPTLRKCVGCWWRVSPIPNTLLTPCLSLLPCSMHQSLANASRSLAKLKLKRGLP